MRKIIWNSLLMILGGSVAATLLLAVCFLLPVRESIYQDSVALLESEGWYPAMPAMSASLDTYFHSVLPGVLDGDTDRIMVDTALDTTGLGNALYRAMDMYSEYKSMGYSYYWHGYVSILRPLMLFFDYGDVRILNGVLQFLLIMTALYFIVRKKGMLYGAAFLSSYFLLFPDALSFSLQFSWVFYIGIVGCIVLLKRGAYFQQHNRYLYLFLILGMCTSYLDLLTYPLYTWGIPLLWWLITLEETETAWKKLLRVVASGLAWIAGYGGFWVMKWLIATIIMKRSIWESAIFEVFLRSGLTETHEMGMVSRMEALSLNWQHYSYKLYMLLLIGWLCFFVIKQILCGSKKNAICPALLLVGASSFVWYFVLADHTVGHHFFTYRIWSVSLLALLLLGAETVEGRMKDEVLSFAVLKRGVLWLGLVLCAGVCALGSRENLNVLNGQYSYVIRELADAEQLEIGFQPSFREITQYSLGLHSLRDAGTVTLKLYHGEELLDQQVIAMSEVGEKHFYSLPVTWKLDPGKEYRMVLTGEDTGGYGVMLTMPEETPLTEYQGLSLDGEILGGQPISGMIYRVRPGIEGLLFAAMTWMLLLYGGACGINWCMNEKCGKKNAAPAESEEGIKNEKN